MRRVLSALAVAAAAATFTVIDAGPASALGNEQLGCYVSPSRTAPQVNPGYCSDSMPASSYSATYQVMNLSGSYTFAWSVPAYYAGKIVAGCTSDSSRCVLSNLTPTREVTVSVTVTQGGQSVASSATADIEPWCGNYFCG